MAEPLAVALHAVNRAGPLLGKAVLVTGCGPIGAMLVVAARRAGATLVVVTDQVAQPLRRAAKVGADAAINVAEHDRAREVQRRQGAVRRAVQGERQTRWAMRGFERRSLCGIVVQVGLAKMTLLIKMIVAKESIRGAPSAFTRSSGMAVDLINAGLST